MLSSLWEHDHAYSGLTEYSVLFWVSLYYLLTVCAVRVIAESDSVQEFISAVEDLPVSLISLLYNMESCRQHLTNLGKWLAVTSVRR